MMKGKSHKKAYASIFEEAEERFLKVAKSNELVMVITNRLEFVGCTGFGYEPKMSDYTLKREVYLGILPGKAPFSRADNDLEILVPSYVRDWGYNSSDKLEEGPIRAWAFNVQVSTWHMTCAIHEHSEPIALDTPLYNGDRDLASIVKFYEESGRALPDYPLEIVVGRKNIDACFADKRRYLNQKFFEKALILLGVEQKKPEKQSEKSKTCPHCGT